MLPETFYKIKSKQESLNTDFPEANHNGEDDLEVKLTGQANNVEDLRKRISFWLCKLDTFQPNGLNAYDFSLF